MSGFFGAALKEECMFDVFYGTDYHSHLGTRRAGLALYDKVEGFDRSIHNIENAPFRTKFSSDFSSMKGQMGIGCISDYEPQPIYVRSHHGSFSIVTVGKINNLTELSEQIINGGTHFFEMTSGEVNPTELVAALINQKENFIDGIKHALEVIDGSISMLILTPVGIYAARDKYGKTPIRIGKKNDNAGFCASFESFAYLNLGYTDYKELGPGEIVVFNADEVKTLVAAKGENKRICTFLWIYYGYPCSSYEGRSVEQVRYNCGKLLAKRDNVKPDLVTGIPDSGIAHAVGYSTESGIPYARPFIKYTPTWPRSFMPPTQTKRNLIAKMKLIPVHDLIEDKSLLLIDDSIVRGTQLRETTEFLYSCGAKEVHIRVGCPPLLYGCKYLNFSRSTSEMELITRRVITRLEGREPDAELLRVYSDPETEEYNNMVEEIRKELHFTSLRYHRLDDMIEATGLPESDLCTYCWSGKPGNK